MARLTDEELERLLRETFADKEELLDTLLQATKRRRPVAPVLLAAAAVLVVLGGILAGVNRDVDPAPPVATAGVSENADIWAAAIIATTLRLDQAAGLQEVQSVLVMDMTGTFTRAERASNVREFSAAEKDRIADLVAKAANVQVRWPDADTALPQIARCAEAVARVSLGEVADKGDHKEVRMSIAYNCGYQYSVAYRVEKRDGSWAVTGTVGRAEGVIPATCPLSGKTPASQQHGC